MSSGSVDIVIVNWNSGAYLAECIASIARLGSGLRDIASINVIDNASSDGSAEFDVCGLPVRVSHNASNVGFGAACNIGARFGSADTILFLNPDTRVEANSISACLAHLNGDVCVVGARLIDANGRVQRTCSRAVTGSRMIAHALGMDRVLPATGYVMSDWAHDETRIVDHVIGAFYLIRRDVFERLGGFDERFFVYLEDLDLSMRVRAEGGKCLFAADAVAHHVGGGSSGSIKATRLFYSVRSRLQFTRKHLDPVSTLLVWFISLTVEPLLRALRALLHRSRRELADVGGGYAQLYRWILP